jgi:hypothetical protein
LCRINKLSFLTYSYNALLKSQLMGLFVEVRVLMMMMMMMDFTVVCDAPTGSVFDLARRITPERV